MKREDFRARVFVATPLYAAQTHCMFTHSLLVSQLDCLMRGIFIEWMPAPGFSLVQFARDYLTYLFLKDESFTHILWADSDLAWRPDSIRRLVDRNLDVVGGVYTTKSPTNPIYPYISEGPVVDGLQEVSKLPGGFLLISRKAMEAVAAKCRKHKMEHDGVEMVVPYVFELLLNGEDLSGEDYVLCSRLRDAGFKVYAETDIDFTHMGLYEWPANLARALEAQKEQPKKNNTWEK